MRLTTVLPKPANKYNARGRQTAPIPFQMLLPLKLKKTVSGKSDKTQEAVCMQEMALMFACFKKSEFDQQQCLKEVAAFQGCYNEYKEKAATLRAQERQGILVPGEKKLTHRQMNTLLKAFPPQP